MGNRLLTKEQDRFLRTNLLGMSNKALTELINQEFGLALKVSQIKTYKKARKLRSGLTGRFEKGCVSHNKGKKFPGKVSSTSFRNGDRPHNTLPIGAERVREGYGWVKVAEPNQWRQKHILIWEAAYGEIPKGHAIVFADQNRLNFDLDNLVLVSREELQICNKKGLLSSNEQLNKSGILVSKVIAKSRKRWKEK